MPQRHHHNLTNFLSQRSILVYATQRRRGLLSINLNDVLLIGTILEWNRLRDIDNVDIMSIGSVLVHSARRRFWVLPVNLNDVLLIGTILERDQLCFLNKHFVSFGTVLERHCVRKYEHYQLREWSILERLGLRDIDNIYSINFMLLRSVLERDCLREFNNFNSDAYAHARTNSHTYAHAPSRTNSYAYAHADARTHAYSIANAISFSFVFPGSILERQRVRSCCQQHPG